jgi:hypothetical protein
MHSEKSGKLDTELYLYKVRATITLDKWLLKYINPFLHQSRAFNLKEIRLDLKLANPGVTLARAPGFNWKVCFTWRNVEAVAPLRFGFSLI